MKKLIFVIVIILSSCTYEPYEYREEPKEPKYDYNQPSYYFKHNLQPNVDLLDIALQLDTNAQSYGGFDTGVAYADFDNDGLLDISFAFATGEDGTNVKHLIALNKGKGKYIDGTYLISNPNYEAFSSRKTIIGDFNNDGKPDVVRPTGAHRFVDYSYIMLSNEFGYTFKSLGGDKRDSHTISSGDIDNDGDLDLVFAGETSEGVLFGVNDGSANFTWDLKWNGTIHEAFTSEMLDINKDGNIDLILGAKLDDSDIKGLNILWGEGNGSFSYNNSSPIYNNLKTYTSPDDLLVSDLDKDGNLDIVTVFINLVDNSSILESFKGSSDYSFTNNTSEWFDNNNTTASGCCSSWVWLYLEDRDKNGSIDLYDPSKYNSQHFEWNGYSFIRK